MIKNHTSTREQAQAKSRSFCPRCGGRLYLNQHREPNCFLCGFVDYKYANTRHKRRDDAFSGTDYALRYIGDFPAWQDVVCRFRLTRRATRTGPLDMIVSCPDCGADMKQSSLSGKRKDIQEGRFVCPKGFRVSIASGKDGVKGWR